MTFKHFSHNGQLRPISEAQVPLALVEYSYGFGVYENIRYANGIVYFLDDHVERLLASARIIELEHEFTAEQVGRWVQELVRGVDGAVNVKILLIGGAGPAEAQLFMLGLNPLFPDRKLYRDGVAVITAEYERAFPHAKTLNMLQSFLAYRRAKRAGAYDALLINRDGNITEGTRTNFFAMRGDVVVSPPESDILLGVTRKVMMRAAAGAGFRLEHQEIGRNELRDYDGAFITSTSSKIVPIRSVDGEVLWGQLPEPLVRLMRVFGEFLDASRGVLD